MESQTEAIVMMMLSNCCDNCSDIEKVSFSGIMMILTPEENSSHIYVTQSCQYVF